MRRIALMTAVVAAATCLAAPSYAGSGVQHLTFNFDEDPVFTHVNGLGTGCPDFTGTLEEDRHLHLSGIMKVDGSAHATTDVTATVTLTPDDPSAVSYAGGYTQHQAGFFVDEGRGDRVVTTTTHGVITGSDGSTWPIDEVVHLSLDADGVARAAFDRFRCGS